MEENNIKKFGMDDTQWAGSHSFNDVYYRNLKASRPVPGFPYIKNNDINADVKSFKMII